MAERFKPRILAHVSHRNYSPQQINDVAEELGVPTDEQPEFREAVEQLVEAGHVVVGASDTLALPPMGPEVVGRFKLHERGFGFIMPDERNAHGDLFVPQGKSGGALTGDIVRAEVVHSGRRGPAGKSPFTGKIVDIVRRANTKFAGTLEKDGSTYFITPDGTMFKEVILIRDIAKHAELGEKVVVEITTFPRKDVAAEGVITEVLGRSGEPEVETDAICRAFDLPEAFPEEAVEQAREAVRRYDDLDEDDGAYTKRTDLRNDYLITIDPPDAQDFDDAVSISQTKNGVELGVHIADVAFFVTPGSHLDKEAYERGTSCYLPRRVIPMLPEVLSNGVCSLQPGVPR
ncbi:MAG: RNB domain-containing ribonuclease, partial [Phycisphaeraceae bacterium]